MTMMTYDSNSSDPKDLVDTLNQCLGLALALGAPGARRAIPILCLLLFPHPA